MNFEKKNELRVIFDRPTSFTPKHTPLIYSHRDLLHFIKLEKIKTN